jgi:hypothetical protein
MQSAQSACHHPTSNANTRRAVPVALWMLLLLGVGTLEAQIDPVERRVFHLGYAQPLHEHGPIAAYAFYYHNQPAFVRSNLTLRLSVAPVYLDAELGIHEALGSYTDFAIGLNGGGFADSYDELRRGNYITSESFTGHAAELNTSIYHLFNPGDIAPIFGILRSSLRGSFFERDSATDPAFQIPDDLGVVALRAGLRLGGREPHLAPNLAGEFSLWYEGQYRTDPGSYGFDGDRRIREFSHLFWARMLFAYTLPESQRHFEVSLTAGSSLNADRLSAYRLGSYLPLIGEFPLSLPGYHIDEISADQFLLLSGQFHQPINDASTWNVLAFGSVGVVDYLSGLEQPGHWHSGLGGGVIYQSPSGAWHVSTTYAFGISAMRERGRGAHTLTLLLEYDLDALRRKGKLPFWEPVLNTRSWRGLFRSIGGN